MNASIITIGDEILIGQIIDTNSAWIAQEFNLIGAHITGIQSVGDEKKEIIDAIQSSFEKNDIIMLTGGLGPTKDDITKIAIAEFLGVGMEFDQFTYDWILKLFEKWGRNPTNAHREQCYLPEGAIILENKMGTAQGMWFNYQGKVIVSMPGVPYEMKYIVRNSLIPRLSEQFRGRPISHRTILTVGLGESRIAERLASVEDNMPSEAKLAYLPGLGSVRLRITAFGDNQKNVDMLIEEKVQEIEALIPELIFGYEKQTLEEVVGNLLFQKGLTISTAESCTGGLLAHKITSIPGSSRYFVGSIIAYDNTVKTQMLGVQDNTIRKFGAVSEQTVLEMVDGVIKQIGSNIGISVSGIAGPGGGSPEKPVGTIWLAIGNEDLKETRKLQLGKDRIKNIEYTVVQGLNLIRQFVNKHY